MNKPKRSDEKYWDSANNCNEFSYMLDLGEYANEIEAENEHLRKLNKENLDKITRLMAGGVA